MARITPLTPTFKPPIRSSLGIPDGRDVLAVYLWWLRQLQFRAFIESDLSAEVASSVQSIFGGKDVEEPESITTFERTTFETRSPAFDLCAIGSQFE
ncbi:hypothetical protein N0V90_007185 [Kalmusia sp. IMI 367209]|nr:hypothetical protein N0V90_007185 [Kalmusia sp. IMI 367209]